MPWSRSGVSWPSGAISSAGSSLPSSTARWSGRQLGRRELARRDVRIGQPGLPVLDHDGRQVVVGVPVEDGLLHHRARRDDSDDLSVHDAAGSGRVARLLADRHPVALLDQPCEVRLQRVVGDARQGHTLALAHLSRGEGDLQLARDDPGVLVEGLVEVAHAEQQDLVLVLLLDAQVLSSGWSGHASVRQSSPCGSRSGLVALN